jgi:hypothetical protein
LSAAVAMYVETLEGILCAGNVSERTIPLVRICKKPHLLRGGRELL